MNLTGLRAIVEGLNPVRQEYGANPTCAVLKQKIS